jgi:hypothetical protein
MAQLPEQYSNWHGRACLGLPERFGHYIHTHTLSNTHLTFTLHICRPLTTMSPQQPKPSSVSSLMSNSTHPANSLLPSLALPESTAPAPTSTPTTSSTSSTATPNAQNVGAIAGGIVGGLVVLGLILIGVVWLVVRKRRQKSTIAGVPVVVYGGSNKAPPVSISPYPMDGIMAYSPATTYFPPTAAYPQPIIYVSVTTSPDPIPTHAFVGPLGSEHVSLKLRGQRDGAAPTVVCGVRVPAATVKLRSDDRVGIFAALAAFRPRLLTLASKLCSDDRVDVFAGRAAFKPRLLALASAAADGV